MKMENHGMTHGNLPNLSKKMARKNWKDSSQKGNLQLLTLQQMVRGLRNLGLYDPAMRNCHRRTKKKN